MLTVVWNWQNFTLGIFFFQISHMVFFCVDMHQVTFDSFKIITHTTNLASQIFLFYNFALDIPSLQIFPYVPSQKSISPFWLNYFSDSFLSTSSSQHLHLFLTLAPTPHTHKISHIRIHRARCIGTKMPPPANARWWSHQKRPPQHMFGLGLRKSPPEVNLKVETL